MAEWVRHAETKSQSSQLPPEQPLGGGNSLALLRLLGRIQKDPLRRSKGQTVRGNQPYLTGLLINSVNSTFHRAEQRLDLIGRLLQQEPRHKLVHIGSSFVHLGREEKTDSEKAAPCLHEQHQRKASSFHIGKSALSV